MSEVRFDVFTNIGELAQTYVRESEAIIRQAERMAQAQAELARSLQFSASSGGGARAQAVDAEVASVQKLVDVQKLLATERARADRESSRADAERLRATEARARAETAAEDRLISKIKQSNNERIRAVDAQIQAGLRLLNSTNSSERAFAQEAQQILNAGKATGQLVDKQRLLDEVLRRVQTHLNSGSTARYGTRLGDLGKITSQVSQSFAVLSFGPLSGVGSRLIAVETAAKSLTVALGSGVGVGLVGGVLAVGAAFLTLASAISIGSKIVDVTRDFQRVDSSLRVGTGSALEAGVALDFIREQADRLGLPLRESAVQFGKLAAAASGTALAGKPVRDIFIGISEAGTALRLTQEQLGGAFTAIQQIISKNVLSSEELRGQLAERIPGAVGILQRELGKTDREFTKLLETGRILASDAIPALAAGFSRLFGTEAERAAAGLESQINRLSNAIDELFLQAGQGGFIESFTSSILQITEAIKDPSFQEGMNNFATFMGLAVHTVVDNSDKILPFIDFIGGPVWLYLKEGIADKVRDISVNDRLIKSLKDIAAAQESADEAFRQNAQKPGFHLPTGGIEQRIREARQAVDFALKAEPSGDSARENERLSAIEKLQSANYKLVQTVERLRESGIALNEQELQAQRTREAGAAALERIRDTYDKEYALRQKVKTVTEEIITQSARKNGVDRDAAAQLTETQTLIAIATKDILSHSKAISEEERQVNAVIRAQASWTKELERFGAAQEKVQRNVNVRLESLQREQQTLNRQIQAVGQGPQAVAALEGQLKAEEEIAKLQRQRDEARIALHDKFTQREIDLQRLEETKVIDRDRYNQLLAESVKSLDEQLQKITDISDAEKEQIRESVIRIEVLKKNLQIRQQEQEQIRKAYEQPFYNAAENIQRALGDAGTNAIKKWLGEAEGFKGFVIDMIARIASELAVLSFFGPNIRGVAGGGTTGFFGSLLSGQGLLGGLLGSLTGNTGTSGIGGTASGIGALLGLSTSNISPYTGLSSRAGLDEVVGALREASREGTKSGITSGFSDYVNASRSFTGGGVTTSPTGGVLNLLFGGGGTLTGSSGTGIGGFFTNLLGIGGGGASSTGGIGAAAGGSGLGIAGPIIGYLLGSKLGLGGIGSKFLGAAGATLLAPGAISGAASLAAALGFGTLSTPILAGGSGLAGVALSAGAATGATTAGTGIAGGLTGILGTVGAVAPYAALALAAIGYGYGNITKFAPNVIPAVLSGNDPYAGKGSAGTAFKVGLQTGSLEFAIAAGIGAAIHQAPRFGFGFSTNPAGTPGLEASAQSPFGVLNVPFGAGQRLEAQQAQGMLDAIAQFDRVLAQALNPEEIEKVSKALENIVSSFNVRIKNHRIEQAFNALLVGRTNQIFSAIEGEGFAGAFNAAANPNGIALPPSALGPLIAQFLNARAAFYGTIRELSGEYIPQFESTLSQLADKLEKAKEAAAPYGLEVQKLTDAYNQGVQKAGIDAIQDIRLNILSRSDPLAAQLIQDQKQAEKDLAEARAIEAATGLEATIYAEQNAAERRKQIIESYAEQANQSILALRKELTIGDLGGLSIPARFLEAQKAFEKERQDVLSNPLNITERNQAVSALQDLINLGREQFGSGTGFQSIREGGLSFLDFLQNLGFTGLDLSGTSTGSQNNLGIPSGEVPIVFDPSFLETQDKLLEATQNDTIISDDIREKVTELVEQMKELNNKLENLSSDMQRLI